MFYQTNSNYCPMRCGNDGMVLFHAIQNIKDMYKGSYSTLYVSANIPVCFHLQKTQTGKAHSFNPIQSTTPMNAESKIM